MDIVNSTVLSLPDTVENVLFISGMTLSGDSAGNSVSFPYYINTSSYISPYYHISDRKIKLLTKGFTGKGIICIKYTKINDI